MLITRKKIYPPFNKLEKQTIETLITKNTGLKTAYSSTTSLLKLFLRRSIRKDFDDMRIIKNLSYAIVTLYDS
ncbi:hypothetical protein RL73_06780 [Liberibacter crescens]|nr:hypothetical protein RL73_06780 [Liberibacter crescens]